MKTYTVKKGQHHCWHGQSVHIDKKELIISFIAESPYVLKDIYDKEDINKIGGITFGLGKIKKNTHGIYTIEAIHQNSIRIGMWDDNGKVRVYAYWYNKGKRYSQEINTTLYGVYNSYGFKLDRTNDTVKVYNRMGSESFNINYDFKDVPDWGFYCYPYFGGNQHAPVDWKVKLKMI